MTGILRRGENLDTDKHRRKMVRSHRKQTDIYKPRRRPGVAPSLVWLSEGTSSADTLFLGFQPPELGDSKSVVEAPQLWYWVPAA